MVPLLAFAATAIATVFAQSMLVRWTAAHRSHEGSWAVALAMFALASAAFAVGASTGWDAGTFRAFYLLGAIVNVPWLALGTLALLAPGAAARVRTPVLLFTGLAIGAVLAAPLEGPIPPEGIPEGRELFGILPRVLAAAGSGIGAVVVLGGAAWSAWQYATGGRRLPRRAAGNALIAAGVLILSAGGLLEGRLGGRDEAFATTLAAGITVIYAGFLVATPAPGDGGQEGPGSTSSRRSSLPASPRGSAPTTSISDGHL
jgi:hypothetical protein